MKILFFISHQPNPRFIKQINFLAKNNLVTLIFFHRKTLANLNSSLDKTVVLHNLKEIPNASKPIKRMLVYFKAIRKIKKIINLAEFNLVLVNNIDVLLLFIFSKTKLSSEKKETKIVIEISDLREFVFKKSFLSKIMRSLEKKLYTKYIDKLIITSKKYYSYHFENFFKKEIFVLENKLLSNNTNNKVVGTKIISDKIIIGIVGLLLRKDEYIKLFECYKNTPEVEIHVYGKGEYQYVVENYASKYNNITYFGSYNGITETQNIYKSIDVIYLVYDTEKVSLNNKLALPNKLYECMCYKVPMICSKGTYLEERVVDLGIGMAINYKQKNEIEGALDFVRENIEEINNNFNKLNENSYFGNQDYIELETFLKK